MFHFIKNRKLKGRLKYLKEREKYILDSINQDKQSMSTGENIVYTSYFYRNLENQEMELADLQDEIRAIENEIHIIGNF